MKKYFFIIIIFIFIIYIYFNFFYYYKSNSGLYIIELNKNEFYVGDTIEINLKIPNPLNYKWKIENSLNNTYFSLENEKGEKKYFKKEKENSEDIICFKLLPGEVIEKKYFARIIEIDNKTFFLIDFFKKIEINSNIKYILKGWWEPIDRTGIESNEYSLKGSSFILKKL